MNQRVLTYGLAAWAVIATVFLLFGRSGPPSQKAHVESAEEAATAAPAAPPSDEDEAQEQTATGEKAHRLDRYDLCVSEGVPQVIMPQLEAQPVLGVHCGGSARLLRMVAGAPSVLLDVTLTISPPHAHAVAAPLLMSDINGDERPDLLVGQRYEDSDGVPISGSVAILPGATRGGFEPPQKLLSAHPVSLFTTSDPTTKQTTLNILHGRNPHHGQGAQWWRYSRDHNPPRTELTTLPAGSRLLGHLDIDQDGHEELLLAATHQGKKGLWIWRDDAADGSEQRFLPLGALHAAAIGDIDNDGHADALLAGQALFTLRSSRGEAKSEEVPGSRCSADDSPVPCHRDPQILAQGTAGTTLKSYQHPQIKLYAADGATRDIALVGKALAVLSTHILELDGDGQLDLVAIVHPGNNPRAAQLGWLSHALPASEIELGDHRGALPEALLHTSDGLE